MNNDLISRSALKETITKFHQKENDRLHNPLWGSIGLNALNRLIDNAPTVPLPDFKEGYKQAIRDGKTNFSRPQGKKDIRKPYGWQFCSECGKVLEPQDNFCWFCGAELREADNETD